MSEKRNLSRSREKEAPAKQAFPFPGAIPAKSKVQSTSGMKRLYFGGEGELSVSGVQDKENVHLYPAEAKEAAEKQRKRGTNARIAVSVPNLLRLSSSAIRIPLCFMLMSAVAL